MRAEADVAAAPRVAAAEELLRESGVDAARVRARGHRGEIAAVSARREDFGRIRELAADLRGLGFQYVALDLAREGDGDEHAE